jgi:hypothetical protein
MNSTSAGVEKLTVTQLVEKISPSFTETEGSLPCSQGPAIDRSPQPDESIPHHSTLYT